MTPAIPRDRSGHVPEWALYAHFLDAPRWSSTGKRRTLSADRGKAGPKIHAPKGDRFTPAELEATGWWDAVNESDLIGVDDGTSYAFRTFPWMTPRLRSIFSRIAVLAPASEQERIVRIMSESFTKGELEAMARDGLVVVSGCESASYCRADPRIGCPSVRIPSGCSADVLVNALMRHIAAVGAADYDKGTAQAEARVRAGMEGKRVIGKRARRTAGRLAQHK